MSTTEQQLLLHILEEVREIKEQLGQAAGQSHAEVTTSTRGTDLGVKVYVGSPLGNVGDVAVAEYIRLRLQLEEQLMANFPAEVARRARA